MAGAGCGWAGRGGILGEEDNGAVAAGDEAEAAGVGVEEEDLVVELEDDLVAGEDGGTRSPPGEYGSSDSNSPICSSFADTKARTDQRARVGRQFMLTGTAQIDCLVPPEMVGVGWKRD